MQHKGLTVSRRARVSVLASGAVVVPGIVADAGEHAARRFLEFFAATIRNRNTRMAYMTAVSRFFTWCDQHQIGQLADIEPLHVAAYTFGRDPDAVRLVGHRPGRRHQSGTRRARTEACGQDRQDDGAGH